MPNYHMQPQVYRGDYYEIEQSNGETILLPCEAHDNGRLHRAVGVGEEVRDWDTITYEGCVNSREFDIDDFNSYCNAPPEVIRMKSGILCRLSAPGYMGCTEWSPVASIKEAKEHFLSYDDEEEWDSYIDEFLYKLGY